MVDLREVARFAAQCAQDVLEVFERAHLGDRRRREAVDAAWAFARGGKRGRALRDAAWAARRAAGEDERAPGRAAPALVGVLRRYPQAPAGGGRVGELLRSLDEALRGRP